MNARPPTIRYRTRCRAKSARISSKSWTASMRSATRGRLPRPLAASTLSNVPMDSEEGGKALLRSPPLPEIEIPRFGVGGRPCPVPLHGLPASPASILKVYHNQYFSIFRRRETAELSSESAQPFRKASSDRTPCERYPIEDRGWLDYTCAFTARKCRTSTQAGSRAIRNAWTEGEL